MKTTLMLIAETCQDGVGRHVSDLIVGLNKDKYKIVVVHGIERMDYVFETMKETMIGQVTFEPVPSMCRNIHLIRDLEALIQVNSLIRQYQPSIIHCHSSKAGVLGRILGTRKAYVEKVIYTPHAYAIQNTNISWMKYSVYLFIERWLGRRKKTLTINVSKGEQNFSEELKLTNKLSEVVYNAVEDLPPISNEVLVSIREELGVPLGHKLIICIARLYHQKNPQLFIEIAHEMINQRSDVHFVWVGEGEMLESIRASIKLNEEESDRIRFIGHRKDIHQLLCVADVFLSTALYEGLPYTLIEACRASLPVVSTEIVGNCEVVEDGVNGSLFSLEMGVDGAVKELNRLLDDKVLKERMSKNARCVYEQEFQLQAMIHSTEEIYERVYL